MSKKSESSKDDPARVELLWGSKEESVLESWAVEAALKSLHHANAEAKYRHLHHFFGMMSIFIGISFTTLSQLKLPDWVSTIGLAASSSIASVNTFFKFPATSQRHHEYSNKYDEYVKTIRAEICKHKPERLSCGVFMSKAEMKLVSMNRSAPS